MSEKLEKTDIKGHVILLMAPTGSGKGELHRYIQKAFPQVSFAVSCTTREPRPREKDGVNYHFLSLDKFQEKIDRGEFLEWAEFGGNLYGTLKSEILDKLYSGEVVLNEIEVQGVEAFKKIVPKDYLTIVYIDAGGWEVLKRRAQQRAPMSEKELKLRHERFLVESKCKDSADYIVRNYDGQLKQAKQHVKDIVGAIINRVNH